MKTGKQNLIAAAALIACSFGSQAFAQTDCVVLKSVAETEKEVVNDKGEKSKTLVPVGKVVPGTEVIWTVTASNVCEKKSSDKVTINNPVPEHMTLVPGSASGPGADITFSVDGKTYAPAGALTVQENGAARPARAEEYKYIRWEFKNSLAPGASAFARFRAVLN